MAVVFIPYNMRDHGVSLRLKAVQVVKYVPMQKSNPFGAVEGFTVGEANPFSDTTNAAKVEEATADVFGEEEPEAPPKKKAKKAAPKPKDSDEDLGSIIDDWDDE